MNNFYLIKEEGSLYDAFAIVIERTKETETLNAIRTAINDEYDNVFTIGHIDLKKVDIHNPQILHVHAGGNASINMVISEVRLY